MNFEEIMCLRHSSVGYAGAKAFSLTRSEARIVQANKEDYAMGHSGNVYIYVPSAGGPWRAYIYGRFFEKNVYFIAEEEPDENLLNVMEKIPRMYL